MLGAHDEHAHRPPRHDDRCSSAPPPTPVRRARPGCRLPAGPLRGGRSPPGCSGSSLRRALGGDGRPPIEWFRTGMASPVTRRRSPGSSRRARPSSVGSRRAATLPGPPRCWPITSGVGVDRRRVRTARGRGRPRRLQRPLGLQHRLPGATWIGGLALVDGGQRPRSTARAVGLGAGRGGPTSSTTGTRSASRDGQPLDGRSRSRRSRRRGRSTRTSRPATSAAPTAASSATATGRSPSPSPPSSSATPGGRSMRRVP